MLRNNIQIRSITFSAIMIALSVVLTRFGSFYLPGASFIRIGFGSIPTIIASIVVGPLWGAIVGAGADTIGALLFPVGAYFFGYTIDAALQGVLPFFVIFLFKGRYKRQGVVFLTFMVAFLAIISAFSINYSMYRTYELAIWLKYTIPLFFLIYFLGVYIFFHFISKSRAFHLTDRHETRFSLFDIYLVCLVDEVIISMCFLGLWNNVVFDLDWLVNAFTQGLMFTINSLLRTFILFYILNALFKLDSTMQTTLKI